MIRYSLHCTDGHVFDSWFRDSRSFDDLAASRHLSCPQCGSTAVTKALMAPSVQTSRKRSKSPLGAMVTEQATLPLPAHAESPVDGRSQKLRAMVKELRQQMLERSTDVGPAFADEARKIHDGVREPETIHGVASQDEVRALLEDGIDILPVPRAPDEAN